MTVLSLPFPSRLGIWRRCNRSIPSGPRFVTDNGMPRRAALDPTLVLVDLTVRGILQSMYRRAEHGIVLRKWWTPTQFDSGQKATKKKQIESTERE